MIEFICADCGEAFDDPRCVLGGGGDREESWYVCPACGSSNFNDADKCEICGDHYLRDECKFHSTVVCDKCLEKTVLKAMVLLDHGLTKKELEAFYEFYNEIGGDFPDIDKKIKENFHGTTEEEHQD